MRFFMISDLHLGNSNNNNLAEANIGLLCSKIRDEISPSEFLLIIILGDIIEGGRPNGYEDAEKYLKLMEKELKDYKVQLEFIPGNHDLVDSKLENFDNFIQKLGANYSFTNSAVVSKEYDEVKFIFADSTLTRDYSKSGQLDLEAIRSQIKDGTQNILFCHHALTHHSEDQHNCVKDGKSVSVELRKMGIEFYFHSHTHMCDTTFSEECVIEIGCGSISKNINDMPGINNQFSVGGIRDGKIVGIERWIITNDGKNRFAKEELYPGKRKFTDPELIGKKKYNDVPKPHIDRELYQIKNDSFNYLSSQKTPLVDMLGERGRIFLLGNAGDGKTIELQKLACDLFKTPFFPFFYSLKNYTGNKIQDIIPEEYDGLNLNRLVLILDGYDEIQKKYRRDFKGKLNDYIENNPSVRVIVSARRNFCKTSENGESRTLSGFTEYIFNGISDNKVDEYLRELKIDPTAFRKAAKLSRVEDMINSPFYLDGLAKIFLAENKFPSKGLIMEKIVNQRFLKDDEKFSNKDLDEKKYKHFQCLENVAFAMQLLSKNEISDDEYQKLIQSKQRKLIKPSGLFTHENGGWHFTHNNFREFLVAKRFANMPIEQVLGYCCYENEIKPSWTNVFGYFVGLTDDNDLKNWTLSNACETLVKYNPDSLHDNERFEIFKNVFEKYEKNYIRSNEGICSESELAYFACSAIGIAYLIEKINFPVNRFSLHNALRIMQHLPDTRGKQTDMRDCLLEFCEEYPQNTSGDCRSAIHAICQQGLYNSKTTERLMIKFGKCEDDYIRTGLYEYLIYTNEQDNYVQFFLDGIHFITYSLRSSDRIGNESRELVNGLETMSSAESIAMVLEWYCKSGNPDFHDEDKVFCILVSKCPKLYQYGNRETLFNVMYNCWIWATKHGRHRKASAVSEFFKKTDTYTDAVLRLLNSQTSPGIYFGILLKSFPETINTLERLYLENKLPNEYDFAEIIERYCNPTDYNRYAQTIYNVEGKRLPELPPTIDYNKICKDASLEYLSYLFDKSKYQTLIDELLSEVKNENITVEELREELSDLNYYYPIARTKIAIEQHLSSSQCVKDFLKIINWQNFSIDEIYTLIENEPLQLDDHQKNSVIEIVLNECENGILDVAVSEDGSLSRHVCIITRFLALLDITLSQTEISKLTTIPWYGFSDNDSKVKYSYLENKFSKDVLNDQLISDVKKSLPDDNTLAYHIDYLREVKCKDIVDVAREICISKDVDYELGRSAIRYLHDLFGSDYIEHEILPQCDRDMVMDITQIFNDINRNELKKAMERVYCQKKDVDLQTYLISYNSKTALRDYLEEVSKSDSVPQTDGNIIGGTTTAISAVNDLNLFPLLEELTKISCAPSFKDREFNSLRSSLYNAFMNCARTNPDRVLNSIDYFLKSSNTEKDLTYFHRLKNDVIKEAIEIKDIPLSILKVKTILAKSN